MSNQITIKDIAKMCGCGVSTVSRALNNHPDINEETRNKIRDKMTTADSSNPRVWVRKDGKVKYLRKELLKEYINNGWELGRVGYKPRTNKQGVKIE